MVQFTVRNLTGEIERALSVTAARHVRSAEAEHRLILAAPLRSETADFWARSPMAT